MPKSDLLANELLPRFRIGVAATDVSSVTDTLLSIDWGSAWEDNVVETAFVARSLTICDFVAFLSNLIPALDAIATNSSFFNEAYDETFKLVETTDSASSCKWGSVMTSH
jgi:hypothetical protein